MTTDIEDRVSRLEVRVGNVERGLAANTATCDLIKKDTGQLLSLFQASKFGVSLVKWFATVGVPILTYYAAVKGWFRA